MARTPAAPRRIQLWWTPTRTGIPDQTVLEAVLDDADRDRAKRFRVDDARLRFIVAHAMLRILIGRAADLPPASLAFSYGDRGKPQLRGVPSSRAPSFNMSHSGDIAVVGVAPDEVGVDVEWLRAVPNAERLAQRFLSEHEQGWLQSHAPAERDGAFLEVWTCKEAYLKAGGVGIAMPLRDVAVEPEGPRLVRIGEDAAAAADWSLLRAPLPVPAVCTVAVRGTGWSVDVQQFDWTDFLPDGIADPTN